MNFQQFQILGEEIHSQLRRANFDELALPELAAEALAHADLDTDFRLDQVAEFLHFVQPALEGPDPPRRTLDAG